MVEEDLYAEVTRKGFLTYRVCVRHGIMVWGPDGYGWMVWGHERAKRKATRVLARYRRKERWDHSPERVDGRNISMPLPL